MKKALLTILFKFLLVSTLFLAVTAAKDYSHLNLPEGAKLRLGKGELEDIRYSPDGTRLAVATSIGVWLQDTTTYREIALLTGHKASVSSVAFSPDGRTIASGGNDQTIRLWDLVTSNHLRTFSGHGGGVNSVVFSPDGQTLASGSYDGTILLWNLKP